MLEYLSEAVVLNKEPNGDLDARVSLFTKKFGKLVAKAKSVKRIVSKLSAHLEPGNLIDARIVEKNGLQVVDALKKSRLPINPSHLYFLDCLLPEGEAEPHIWAMLLSGDFSWPSILKILGWDPKTASCAGCNSKQVSAFDIRSQEFFCHSCSLKLSQDELLYIYH